jgi:hypothetical protein
MQVTNSRDGTQTATGDTAEAAGAESLTFKQMLELLHPGGVLVGALKPKKGGFNHAFFKDGDIAGLVAHSASHRQGGDVYFAMSGFKPLADHLDKYGQPAPLGSRRSENVESVKALWLDVDCRAGKDYATKREGLEALEAFLGATGLPMPTVQVDSGGGWHIYWALDAALSPEEWKPLAEGLKALCKEHGLQFDAVCTADAARILRPAGGLNHKYPGADGKGVEVRAWLTGEAVPVADMRKLLLGKSGKTWTQARTRANGKGAADGFKQDPETQAAVEASGGDNSALGGESADRDPAYMAGIFEGCAVMQDARDTGGKYASEPLWMGTLGVAAFAEDGKDYIHKLSSGYDGYSEQATEDKFKERLDYAGRGGGPPRCETLAEAWEEKAQGKPCPCETCEHFDTCARTSRIGSPVTLGRSGSAHDEGQGGSTWPQGATGAAQGPQNAGDFRTDFNRSDIPCDVAGATIYLSQRFFVLDMGGKAVVGRFVRDQGLGHERLQTHYPRDFGVLTNMPIAVDKKKTGFKAAGDLWLKARHRPQFGGVGLHITSKVPAGTLNLWRGWGVTPAPGDWSLMEAHINLVICNGVARDYHWLIAWLADAVQRPEDKPGTCVVLRGVQGAGKGVFATEFSKLWGSHGLHLIQREQLVGKFNAHLADKVFLFADEALFAGDKTTAGTLKGLITEKTLIVEAKFRDAITAQNRLHIMMATNSDWAVPADIDDRRFLVLDVNPGARNNRGFFTKLTRQMGNGGRAAWLHFLLNLDLPAYIKEHNINLRKPPVTAALTDQKAMSLDSHEAWWLAVLRSGVLNDWDSKHNEQETQPYDKEWPTMILTARLYELYLEFGKGRHDRHPIGVDAFGKWLRRTVGLKPCRPRAALPLREAGHGYGYGYGMIRKLYHRAYMLPWLDKARQDFEARMGGVWEWEAASEADDETEGETGGPEGEK